MSTEMPPPATPGLPASPLVLLDATTAEQAAAALSRLQQWLHRGDSAATAACAHACSVGEDDATGVARWVGTLADLLRHRIEEANSWS